MVMKHLLTATLFLLVLLAHTTAKAQKDTITYYLDSNLTQVSKSKAVCVEKLYYKKPLWYAIVSYVNKPYKLFTGSYIDKATTRAEGLFNYYNGDTLIMTGKFTNGEQDSVWKKWQTNGLITDSVVFEAGNPVAVAKYSYHINNTLWRYSLEKTSGEKITRIFDASNILVSEGRFIGTGGEMKMYYPDGKLKSHSVYKNNERVIYDVFDENGSKQ